MPELLSRLLTRTEVAALLQVPTSTLAQWAHRGIGPAYKIVGRHARYRAADVDQWVCSQTGGGDGGRAA